MNKEKQYSDKYGKRSRFKDEPSNEPKKYNKYNSVVNKIGRALSTDTDAIINLIYDLGDQQFKQNSDVVRYGQCIANSALGVIPDGANAIRGSSVDCYYRDENVLDYMDALRKWIDENHNFKEYRNKNSNA